MRTTVVFLIGCVVGATGALMVKGGTAAATPVAPITSRGGLRQPAEPPLLPAAVVALPDVRPNSLLIPVRGIGSAELKSTFQESRSGGRRHEAIDILAPRGTPVLAVADGTIHKLFTSRAGGLTIYHYNLAESACYYYAHLDRYADIKEGQRVSRGEVIGYVGTSGNAPPNTPHLHFAINQLTATKEWWKGTPVDPYPYFR